MKSPLKPSWDSKAVSYTHLDVYKRQGKFYENNCLVDQAFVKDSAMTVGQYIDKVAKELGGVIKVKEMVRFEKGEGLQKREDNFADEVASMMK